MNKIETKEQYEWAVTRVEQLLPLVNENTPSSDPVADYSEAHFSIDKSILDR